MQTVSVDSSSYKILCDLASKSGRPKEEILKDAIDRLASSIPVARAVEPEETVDEPLDEE